MLRDSEDPVLHESCFANEYVKALYRQTLPGAQWLPSTCTLTEYDSCHAQNKLITQTFDTLGASHTTKRITQWNGCEQGVLLQRFHQTIKTMEHNTGCHRSKVLCCLFFPAAQ